MTTEEKLQHFYISIHTLLAESDPILASNPTFSINFNPHPPRGE